MTPIKCLPCALGLMLAVFSTPTPAQYRENMPSVVEKQPAHAEIKPPDLATFFSKVYTRAGRPRIALMWNRPLSDKIKSDLVEKKITRDEGNSKSDSLERMTSAPSGTSSLKDSDESYQSTTTVTTIKSIESEMPQKITLAEKHAAVLQRNFVIEMNRGGVHFVDRALVMRLASVSGSRADTNPASIEIESLVSHADLILEILMVEDKDAPVGYGFDIRAKDLKRGIEIASAYSRAMPDEGPRRPGAWVAGQNDYEFKVPLQSGPPSPGQIGVALARDVMFTLGSSLETLNFEAINRSRK